MRIGNYNFEGPYTSTTRLQNRSGVYAILSMNGTQHYLIDVGESHDVRYRVENHDRSDCWSRNGNGQLSVAVLYTPNQQQAGRRVIENQIRDQFNPVCGDR